MGGKASRPLTEAEDALLAALAGRKIAGPSPRTDARDHLRRIGYIKARQRDFRQGQDTLWDVTGDGLAYLGRRALA